MLFILALANPLGQLKNAFKSVKECSIEKSTESLYLVFLSAIATAIAGGVKAYILLLSDFDSSHRADLTCWAPILVKNLTLTVLVQSYLFIAFLDRSCCPTPPGKLFFNFSNF